MAKIILLILLVLSLIPYAIPLPAGTPVDTPPFEESVFTLIDGVNLHYRIWIPETVSGKVLLIHGLGGSTFSWRHNIQPLVEAGFLVTAVDLPGFGYSSRQKGVDHSQENRSDLIWKLLKTIDLSLENEAASLPWDLAGHSMGGGTVAAMALQYPSRTASLIFVAGAVYRRPSEAFSSLLSFPPAGRWLKVAAHYYFLTPERIKGFLASAYGEEPSPHAVEGYLAPLAIQGTATSLIDMVLTAKEIPPGAIGNIASPALLIWGVDDRWVPLEAGQRLAKDLPNAQMVIIPATRHCPMETEPEEFNELLLRFLFHGM